MKRIVKLAVISALAGLVSCTPSAYKVFYEGRNPSDSGLDLGGKSMAVVYLESEDGCDSLFNNRFSDTFAQALEKDYFGGDAAVDVFHQVKEDGRNYSSIEEMSDMVMKLGNDVIFLVDTPLKSDDGKTTFVNLYVYDSMSRGVDNVIKKTNSATATVAVSEKAIAKKLADSMAGSFLSNWSQQSVTLLYFDIEDEWIMAISHACSMDWQKASDIWLKLCGRKTGLARAAAEYNLAVACYIEEELDLALEWLNRADDDYAISLSSELRKTIEGKR